LIAFNHEAFPIAVRQTDPALRLAALDNLKSWGSTALYDTIVLGVNRFGQQQGRKVLVVFTDGEDQGSRATLADAQVQLRDSDAVVYIIGAGRALGSEAFRRGLRALSEVTGGRAIFTDRIDRLREVFRELVEELSAQYLLSYIPTNAEADGTWRRIKVTVGTRTSARVRATAPLATLTAACSNQRVHRMRCSTAVFMLPPLQRDHLLSAQLIFHLHGRHQRGGAGALREMRVAESTTALLRARLR
jgi:hypothetical protein